MLEAPGQPVFYVRITIPPCRARWCQEKSFTDKFLYHAGQGQCYILHMTKEAISKYLTAIAKRGGKARAKKLTPERRKEIATEASKAAAAARTRRAKEKKKRAEP